MVALRCFDHILRQPPRMLSDNATVVSRYLEDYDAYAQLMRLVVMDWKRAGAAALLGLVEVAGESTVRVQEFHVLPTSALYEYSRESLSGDEHDITISADRLEGIIRSALGQRMLRRLQDEHKACLSTKVFRPCINVAVIGRCLRPNCPHDHVSRDSHNLESFNLRIRLHMQQILIVHHMDIDHRRQDLRR
jgi:hypothetical protein